MLLAVHTEKEVWTLLQLLEKIGDTVLCSSIFVKTCTVPTRPFRFCKSVEKVEGTRAWHTGASHLVSRKICEET